MGTIASCPAKIKMWRWCVDKFARSVPLPDDDGGGLSGLEEHIIMEKADRELASPNAVRLVAAQQRYNRVVQVRAMAAQPEAFRDAIDFVHSGKLGKDQAGESMGLFCVESNPVYKAADANPPAGSPTLICGSGQPQKGHSV